MEVEQQEKAILQPSMHDYFEHCAVVILIKFLV